MMNDRIGVKDLVNVGIFTALYFVMFFISGMSGLIPVMAVFYPALLAILGGIPCILFFTKTQKFGLVTIMGALLGLITFLMGYGPYAIATGVGCGLIADLVLKAGKYQSWKRGPVAMLEYRFVPLIVSVVRIGDELSAAAVTRGLGGPIRRTNYCKIGFSAWDFACMAFWRWC